MFRSLATFDVAYISTLDPSNDVCHSPSAGYEHKATDYSTPSDFSQEVSSAPSGVGFAPAREGSIPSSRNMAAPMSEMNLTADGSNYGTDVGSMY